MKLFQIDPLPGLDGLFFLEIFLLPCNSYYPLRNPPYLIAHLHSDMFIL